MLHDGVLRCVSADYEVRGVVLGDVQVDGKAAQDNNVIVASRAARPADRRMFAASAAGTSEQV